MSAGESAELTNLRNEHTKLSTLVAEGLRQLEAQYKAMTEQFAFTNPEIQALGAEYDQEKSKEHHKNFRRLALLKAQLAAAREADLRHVRKGVEGQRSAFKKRLSELEAAISRQEERDRATKADLEALVEEQLKLDQDLEAKRLDLTSAAEEEDWEKCVVLEREIASMPKTALEMRQATAAPSSGVGHFEIGWDEITGVGHALGELAESLGWLLQESVQGPAPSSPESLDQLKSYPLLPFLIKKPDNRSRKVPEPIIKTPGPEKSPPQSTSIEDVVKDALLVFGTKHPTSQQPLQKSDTDPTTGARQLKPFPAHWGEPPKKQTRDLRRWPDGYGAGSGTMAKWIQDKMFQDVKDVAATAQASAPKSKAPTHMSPETWANVASKKEKQKLRML